jgi:hypothetical protein
MITPRVFENGEFSLDVIDHQINTSLEESSSGRELKIATVLLSSL